MNIYEYLKKDHEKVEKLFSQFEKEECPLHRAEIFSLLKEELILHTVSEQETFYKTLEDYAEKKDKVRHGWKEHAEVEEKLEEIGDPKKITAVLEKKILKLKEMVEHHVKEEEGPIFKEAKKVFSDEEAWELKEKMHAYKEKMLSVKKIS